MTRWTMGLGVALLVGCGDSSGGTASMDAATGAEDASVAHDAAPTVDARGLDATVDSTVDAAPASEAGAIRLPPAGAGFDYQLGGAYAPPAGVTVVARDREAEPAPGLYNVCYVNGFQAQEGEARAWLRDHPMLILRDQRGEPVIDRDWNEMLLDYSTADKRTELAQIVGDWIAGCGAKGFDAVEIDNLDSFSRSGGRLKEDDAVAFMALLSQRAHAAGMAIAQKNSAEIVARRAELGTDFAVSEECARYDECGVYTRAYERVLMIEYRRPDFERSCGQQPNASIVLRDVELRPAGRNGYVFEQCAHSIVKP